MIIAISTNLVIVEQEKKRLKRRRSGPDALLLGKTNFVAPPLWFGPSASQCLIPRVNRKLLLLPVAKAAMRDAFTGERDVVQ